MSPALWKRGGWRVLAVFVVLLSSSCGRPAARPNVQPTAPAPAGLTAVQAVVQRLRPGAPDVSVAQGASVDIRVNDRVQVGDKGRGLLRFPDGLTVEILRQTDLTLGAVQLEPSGFVLTRIKQSLGHTHVELEQAARQRVALQTDLATVTAVPGSEVMLWHEPGEVTCMVAVKGEAQVTAGQQTVTARGGEATYVLPGQAPVSPICAQLPMVVTWLDNMRNGRPAPTLDDLVRSWPQKPCPPGTYK